MLFRPLYQFSTCLQHLYPYGVFRRPCHTLSPQSASAVQKVAYITFDDGPIPEVTPRVLDILGQYDVKATFFMVGDNVDKYPELFQQVIQSGHSVGNHTYHHVKGFRMAISAYLREVELCEEAFARHRGEATPSPLLFRPPYGRSWPWQRAAIAREGYNIYLWDVLTHDYAAKQTPQKMLDIVRTYVRDGSIINFHDSIKSNERMLTALPQVIEYLQQQGYTLLPLSAYSHKS